MKRTLLCLPVVAWSLMAVAAEPEAAKPPPAEKPKLAVTISKETTFLTEPLDADGYPDYQAAMERAAKKGVTAKNNLLVMLYQIMGTQLAGNELTPAYYKKLGLKKLPEDEHYFVSWEKYIEAMTPEFLPPATAEEIAESKEYDNADEVRESLIRVRLRLQKPQRPWKAKEYPHLSAWLNDIAPQLDLLRELEQRTHYYDPSSEPDANPYQELPQLFHAISQRALRDAGEERWDAAWEQVTNLLTLAERMARVPDRFLYEEAARAYNTAFRTAQAIAFDPRVDTARLQRWQTEITKRQIPSSERCYTWTERLITLSWIVKLAKQKERPATIGILGDIPPWHARYSLAEAYDFDQALRLVNARYEVMAAGYQALQKDEPTRFLGELNKADFEFSKFYRSRLGNFLLKDADRQKRTETLVQLYYHSPQYTLIDTVRQEYESRTRQNLTRLQFALQLYQREHGRYPDKLAALTPKYFDKLPWDYETDHEAYLYKTNGRGFLLYGLGRDGEDSGGRYNLDSHVFVERYDDPAVYTVDHEPQ